MHPFNGLLEEAKTAGVEVRTFCSFCPEAATGDLMMDDGSGEMFPVPICAGCLEVVQKKYSNKFDN